MNQPRPESRISELESQMSIQGARIRELSSDTAEELRAISQDLKKLFEHMHKGFDQAHTYVQENMATKEDVSKLRDEMTAMEGRINANIIAMTKSLLDAIKQQKLGGEQ